MNTSVILSILLLSATTIFAPLATAQPAGTVTNVSGQVSIERNGKIIAVERGMVIESTDKVITGKNGSVGVVLTDDTRLAVGGKTAVTLEKYEYNPTDGKGSVALRVLRGTMGVVTGKINKTTGNDFTVMTKTATAGIRGTEFIVEVPEE
jgi:hypothetical protein